MRKNSINAIRFFFVILYTFSSPYKITMYKRITLFVLICVTAIFAQAQNSCPAGMARIVIKVTPDNYPQETSWSVKDNAGNIVATGTSNSDTLCVPNNKCYLFAMKDSYGDGMCCAFGMGSYLLMYNADTIRTGGQFAYQELSYMGCGLGDNCQTAININGNTGLYVAPKSETWYQFTPDTTGQYSISTCLSTNTCDTKIYLYDYCTNLSPDTTNIATIYYNDDLCGLQAEISPVLQANKPYYLRIGDKNGSCANNAISWRVNYLGAIVGCTDPTACNYSPLATVSGLCMYPGNPNCPAGPDLIVNQNDLSTSIHLTTINNSDQCMVNEGCVNGYGQRTVIRFTTTIANIGTQDYFIGAPANQPNQFDWDPCHQHHHYTGYAEYVLFDASNNAIPVGFKSGFCVLDLGCPAGGNGKYGCNNMGISFNCQDTYDQGLDCQWVDITDIDTGRYTLMIRVNWDMSLDAAGRQERNYNNNYARVCVKIGMGSVGVGRSMQILPNCPPVLDCLGVPFGRAKTDCNGMCNGNGIWGDVNQNGNADSLDVQDYAQLVINPSIPHSACADLNQDQTITIADAAMLNNCLLYGNRHNHPIGTHNHCTYKPMLYNPNDSIIFSIENAHISQGYFDVYVRNPNGNVAAAQFTVSGVQLSSIMSLTNKPFTFMHNALTNTIAGMSYADSSLSKSQVAQPFCRVYFTSLMGSYVCIQTIREAITGKYERGFSSINSSNCVSIGVGTNEITQNAQIRIYPNPANASATVEIDNESGEGIVLNVFDVLGSPILSKSSAKKGTQLFVLDVATLPKGVYLVQVKKQKGTYSKRLVVN